MRFNYYYFNLLNHIFWIKLMGVAIVYRGREGLRLKVTEKLTEKEKKSK